MSWSTVVRSYRAPLKMLLSASLVQLNMRGVTGGTTRHKYDKKNPLSKDANGIEARVDRRVTGCASPVSSAREMAMGRFVMCGPTCFKKCSGPDSMSGDARAFSGIGALNTRQFVIGVFRHAAVCAKTRRQGRSHVRTLLRCLGGVVLYAVHLWCNDKARIVTTRYGMASCIDSHSSLIFVQVRSGHAIVHVFGVACVCPWCARP